MVQLICNMSSNQVIKNYGLQDPGECLPVLLESPLILSSRGVVVVDHLRKLLLRDGLVLRDIGDLPHLRAELAESPTPLWTKQENSCLI